MKLIFTEPWKYSPNGYDVVELAPGEHDVPERFAAIAVHDGVAKKAPEKKPDGKAAS